MLRDRGLGDGKAVYDLLAGPYVADEKEPDNPGSRVRSDVVETLKSLGADLKPLASKWVPRLVVPLETEYEVHGNITELGAYGPLAHPAVPELFRYARVHPWGAKLALESLSKIAPEDERVRALSHLAHFQKE